MSDAMFALSMQQMVSEMEDLKSQVLTLQGHVQV